MLIFAVVQCVFVLTIKVVSAEIMLVLIPFLLILSALIIFKFAPLEHPNKPLSDKKKVTLRRKALVSTGVWVLFGLAFPLFNMPEIGFYSSAGMFMLGIAILAEKIKQKRCVVNEKN